MKLQLHPNYPSPTLLAKKLKGRLEVNHHSILLPNRMSVMK